MADNPTGFAVDLRDPFFVVDQGLSPAKNEPPACPDLARAPRMPIHCQCPVCTFPFGLGDELEGSLFTCTSCGEAFQVPAPPPPPLPPLELIQSSSRVLG